MEPGRMLLVLPMGACLLLAAGCQEKKTTRSVTVEGPEKKRVIKMETTEKKPDKSEKEPASKNDQKAEEGDDEKGE